MADVLKVLFTRNLYERLKDASQGHIIRAHRLLDI